MFGGRIHWEQVLSTARLSWQKHVCMLFLAWESKARRGKETRTRANCTFAPGTIVRFYRPSATKALEDQGAQKILVGSSHVPYSTKPATSGPHWAIRPDQNDLAKYGSPVKWGKYDEEVPDEALLHNLSHGGIGIHYDCEAECKDLISKLDTLRAKDDTQIVLSPYRGMKSRIALTSWRHVQFLDEFNEDTIMEFIKAYRDRAPESWIGNYWGDAIQ